MFDEFSNGKLVAGVERSFTSNSRKRYAGTDRPDCLRHQRRGMKSQRQRCRTWKMPPGGECEWRCSGEHNRRAYEYEVEGYELARVDWLERE